MSDRYDTVEALDEALTAFGTHLAPMPRAPLFLAGKACRRYRSRGGTRTGALSDFFIGAHAVVLNCALLTRDAGRYRHYFPTIRLVAPD
jgi:predicted nucleic acid-binding protein